MEYKDIISEKLKEIRKSKRLTQTDVAEKAGIPRSSVSYYENGRTIDLDMLQKVCTGLNIDMFTFLDECKREMEKCKKEGK